MLRHFVPSFVRNDPLTRFRSGSADSLRFDFWRWTLASTGIAHQRPQRRTSTAPPVSQETSNVREVNSSSQNRLWNFLTTAVNDGFKRVSTTDQRATLS